MKESHLRSLLKAVSWRIFGTFSTALMSYLVTHEIKFAIYIGALEFISKIVCFYVHERLWIFFSLGMLKPKMRNDTG